MPQPSFNCVLKLRQDTCGQYVRDIDSPHQELGGCPSCVHRSGWENQEADLISFFKPITLAAIVADLLDLGTTTTTMIFCNRAYLQGVALVGREEFKKMIEEAI